MQDGLDSYVSVDESAFALGEGILETMIAVDGRIVREARHQARTERGLQLLGIDDFEWGLAARRVADVTSRAQLSRARVRMVVSRGRLLEGFGAPAINGSTTVVTIIEASPPPKDLCAVVVDWPRRSGAGLNVEFKSLGYANERYARKRAQAAGGDIAILLSEQGFVACADTANLFVLTTDKLLTPPKQDGALLGTVREQILEDGSSLGFELHEQSIAPDDLHCADAVLLSNAGFGVCPLVEIKGVWQTRNEEKVQARIDRLRRAIETS